MVFRRNAFSVPHFKLLQSKFALNRICIWTEQTAAQKKLEEAREDRNKLGMLFQERKILVFIALDFFGFFCGGFSLATKSELELKAKLGFPNSNWKLQTKIDDKKKKFCNIFRSISIRNLEFPSRGKFER